MLAFAPEPRDVARLRATFVALLGAGVGARDGASVVTFAVALIVGAKLAVGAADGAKDGASVGAAVGASGSGCAVTWAMKAMMAKPLSPQGAMACWRCREAASR